VKILGVSTNSMKTTTNNKQTAQVQFAGLQNLKSECMCVLDLDNTLTLGSAEEIRRVIQKISQLNGKIIYATGNTKKQFLDIQQRLALEGIELPTPDYLIANNSQFLYKKAGDFLIKEKEYEKMLQSKTNFDSKKVLEEVQKLVQRNKYKYAPKQMQKHLTHKELEEIKASDPTFYDKKVTFYNWSPSKFMSEYFLAADVNVAKFKKEIKKQLSDTGIKTKFIENNYPKKIMDRCRKDILLQANPLRRNKDGGMFALFLCPANKADGVMYLKKKFNIPYKEIVMAGDDNNDISMVLLSRKGAHFLCPDNASKDLRKTCEANFQNKGQVIFTLQQGAKSIFGGISALTAKFNSNLQ